MNFSVVEKIKKLIFNLYSFNATVIYRDSNFRKKCIGGLDVWLTKSPTAIFYFQRRF